MPLFRLQRRKDMTECHERRLLPFWRKPDSQECGYARLVCEECCRIPIRHFFLTRPLL